jgi:hypothetical protein
MKLIDQLRFMQIGLTVKLIETFFLTYGKRSLLSLGPIQIVHIVIHLAQLTVASGAQTGYTGQGYDLLCW